MYRFLLILSFLSWAVCANAQSNFERCAESVGNAYPYGMCDSIFTQNDGLDGSLEWAYLCREEFENTGNFMVSFRTKLYRVSKDNIEFLEYLGVTRSGDIIRSMILAFYSSQVVPRFATLWGDFAFSYCRQSEADSCVYEAHSCHAQGHFPARACEYDANSTQFVGRSIEVFSAGCTQSCEWDESPMYIKNGTAFYGWCKVDYEGVRTCHYTDPLCEELLDSDGDGTSDTSDDDDDGDGIPDDDDHSDDTGNDDDDDDDDDTGTGADCKEDERIKGNVKFCPNEFKMAYDEFRIMRCGALEGNCKGKDSTAVICHYQGLGCNGGSYIVSSDSLNGDFVKDKDEQSEVTMERFYRPEGRYFEVENRCEADEYCMSPLTSAKTATEPKDCDYENAPQTVVAGCPVLESSGSPAPHATEKICSNGCPYINMGDGYTAFGCTYRLTSNDSGDDDDGGCGSEGSSTLSGLPCGVDGKPPCKVSDSITHQTLADIKSILDDLGEDIDESISFNLKKSTDDITDSVEEHAINTANELQNQTRAIVEAIGRIPVTSIDDEEIVRTIQALEKTYKDSLDPDDFEPSSDMEEFKIGDSKRFFTQINVSQLLNIPAFSAGSCPLTESVKIDFLGAGDIEFDFSMLCIILYIAKILIYVSTLMKVQAIVFKS
ncbi:hypothetical protein BegalDRAFT_0946 [Beggiatoa alba B18LD]|uniref:Thrombospondin type 3 repeat-containing protein n=1 Tax=Beggiatoa alba B18LD TaxID=395493 RepID=I3CE10_9GAMM|nr:hypothetical protein [Beggiatoa alba]EIJ41853.1 hypothetical protein BegalDRAFT_0946 [Beggiatoa alba B18LD]